MEQSFKAKGLTFFTELYAAVVVGIFALVTRISFAVFIFSGLLSPYLFSGLTFVLFSSVLVLLITSVLSKIKVNIALPSSATLSVFGVMTFSLAALLVASGLNHSVFSTVLVAMSIATLATGISFYVLGRFKWGNFVRFIPFPLIAGFLSSSGWLILVQSVKILLGPKLGIAMFLPLNLILLKIVPVAIYLCGVLIAYKKFKGNTLIILLMVLLSVISFYLLLFWNHFTLDEARAQGFLFTPVQPQSLFYSMRVFSWASVNWSSLLSQFWNIIIIIAVSILSFLFNAAGIGLVMSRDVKFNRELRVAGLANIISACGGMVSFMSAPATIANYRLNIKSIRVAWMIAGLFILALLWPRYFFELLPKPVVVGFLVPTGFTLVKEWAFNVRKILPLLDYLLVLTVLVITAIFGLLNGIFVGLIIAITLFAFKYAKLNIVDYKLTGEEVHSNMQRTPETQQFLLEHASFILYFKLQNYIFFGTAYSFLQKIKIEIKNSREFLKYIILDFAEVSGMDSSAVFSFIQLVNLFEKNNIILVITQLKSEMHKQLKQSGVINDSSHVKVISNSDYAVQWCQDEFLNVHKIHDQKLLPLVGYLQQFFKNPAEAQKIADLFEQFYLYTGDYLFKAGDIALDLYYVEFGVLTVEGPATKENSTNRYYTVGPGNIIGEMAIYLQAVRTAPIVAEANCILQKLSFEKIQALEENDPHLAYEIHRFLASIIAQKLTHMNKYVQTLLR